MLFSTYTFTEQPYTLSSIPLGSLVSEKKQPIEDIISKVTAREGTDYIRLNDTQLTYYASSSTAARAKAYISRIFLIHLDAEQNANLQVNAKQGFTYQLRNPGEFFRNVCQDQEVRRWLQEGYDDRQDSYFVTGYRTLVDAHLVSVSDSSWILDAGGGIPAEATGTGDGYVGAGFSRERGIQQKRDFPGERIFCICYRKVQFKFHQGLESSYLKRGACWESISKTLGEANNVEIVEANIEEEVQDGEEGIEKISFEKI